MEPIRKSDGYTLEGVKKYKRYFQIKKKHLNNDTNNDVNIKKIEFNNIQETEDIIKE
jgi:hypothetical protein